MRKFYSGLRAVILYTDNFGDNIEHFTQEVEKTGLILESVQSDVVIIEPNTENRVEVTFCCSEYQLKGRRSDFVIGDVNEAERRIILGCSETGGVYENVRKESELLDLCKKWKKEVENEKVSHTN